LIVDFNVVEARETSARTLFSSKSIKAWRLITKCNPSILSLGLVNRTIPRKAAA